jgi:DNA repair photolyase
MELPLLRGRGSHLAPDNRFTRLTVERDPDAVEDDDGAVNTQYYVDDSKSVVAENASPDVPFRYSVNPYRGCLHGCSYCFARPTHEYLDFNAGIDFETRIMVKPRAAELFRTWMMRPCYVPETVALSGVTDCYQPIEKKLQITRQCLQVAESAGQPIGIITKNALVTRDIDLLGRMAARSFARVNVSVTTLDQSLTKVMEPRSSAPAARLRAIRELSAAGVPVNVLVAPVVPGLTDHETPAILEAVKDAGARSAGYVMLRLPLTVKPVFFEWLERTHPGLKSKVEARLRSLHDGELYQSNWGHRQRGRGEFADAYAATFALFAKKHGLDRTVPPLSTEHFRRPIKNGQKSLFD